MVILKSEKMMMYKTTRLFLRDSSIGWELRLMKRKSLNRIPHPLLCEYVKKKKEKKDNTSHLVEF
jgi:hypothetical protein